MLDDMPKSQSVALTADPEDAIATMDPPAGQAPGQHGLAAAADGRKWYARARSACC